jgi:hypothetical protein
VCSAPLGSPLCTEPFCAEVLHGVLSHSVLGRRAADLLWGRRRQRRFRLVRRGGRSWQTGVAGLVSGCRNAGAETRAKRTHDAITERARNARRPAKTDRRSRSYLWQGNKDTLYRIHSTNEPWTVGQNVSAGCTRLTNDDVTDLYDHIPIGTKVVVLPTATPTAPTQ